MKKLLYIARYPALAVLQLLLLALAPAIAQNVVYQGETTPLTVDEVPGFSYEWELYSDGTVNLATVPGNCPPAMAAFVGGNIRPSVNVKWLKTGIYYFKLTVWDASGCGKNIGIGSMEVKESLSIFAGNPVNSCPGSPILLTEATAQNFSTLLWASSGDGIFDDPTILNPVYTPGSYDLNSGNVTLTLTTDGLGNSGSSTSATSAVRITIVPLPKLVITNPPAACEEEQVDLSDLLITAGSDIALKLTYWTDSAATIALTDYKTLSFGGTYYIKATNGFACPVVKPVEVRFNKMIKPAFATLALEYCPNSIAPALPAKSDNGITGVWDHAIISTNIVGKTFYRFSPDPGQCASVLPIEIEITDEIKPIFSFPVTYCINSLAAALPAIADNGVKGTWSPDKISTNTVGTSPYKFSPDAGQCGASITIFIAITEIVPFFNISTNLCQNSIPPVLPGISDNNIKGHWSPAVVSTDSIKTYPYTFIANSGQCTKERTIKTFTIYKRDVPLFDAIQPLCMESTPPVLPTTSKNGINGTWSPSEISTAISGNATYTFVPDVQWCAETVPLVVKVYDKIEVFIHADPLLIFGGTTKVTVSASGGSGNYTSGIDVFDRGTGTYTFMVTDDAGCSGTGSIFIDEPHDLKVTATMTKAIKCIGGRARIEVHVNGGTNPVYSYTGGNPSYIPENDSVFLAQSSAIPYVFKVVDANNKYGQSIPILVSDPPVLTLAVSSTGISCAGGATGTATVTASGRTGLPIYSWDDPLKQITATATGLKADTYKVTVTDDCGPVSTTVVVPETQEMILAALGIDSQCLGKDGSIQFSFTNIPDGKYDILHADGVFKDVRVSGKKATFDARAGTYNNLKVIVNGCSTADGVNATVKPAPEQTVIASVTQPDCAIAGTIKVTTPAPAAGISFTLTGTNPVTVPIINVTGAFAGLSPGSYKVSATNAAGCISTLSEDVIINAQLAMPSAPSAGIITQPTCSTATGSVMLTGLPAGNWTINPGNISGNTTTYTVTGLAANSTYNFNVTNAAGCVSAASPNIVINVQLATPSAPLAGAITQPTCSTETGSVVLAGLPAGNWTIQPGNIRGNTTTYSVTGLAANSTYNFMVTNAAGCVSGVSADVVIIAKPATPSAPLAGTILQPNCLTSTGSVVLTGLPAGNWTINPGNISGNTTSYTVTGLAANSTYNFKVTNAAGCVSPTSANVVIIAKPVMPSAPLAGTILQPNCLTSTGSVVLTGLPAGNWTIQPGNISGNTTTYSVTSLAANSTYNFKVTNAAGCVSSASANVVINAQPIMPSAPLAGKITQPICSTSTGSVVLTGLPAGNWTIQPGNISGNTTTYKVTGLAANSTYNFTVTNAAGCVSSASADVVIIAKPATPSAPLAGKIIQPNCLTSTGSVVLTSLPAGNWNIQPGNISGNATTYKITGLAANSTYNFTVTNAAGCVSAASANVVIIAKPATPSTPMAGTIIQPNCLTSTGSIVLTGLPSGNWTINPGNIRGNTTTCTVTGLAANSTYGFTVANESGCISIPTIVKIDPMPVNPPTPVAKITFVPTCNDLNGTFEVTKPLGVEFEYSLNGIDYQSSAVFDKQKTGRYIIRARNINTHCVSDTIGIAIPAIPPAPILSVSSIENSLCFGGEGSISFTVANAKDDIYTIKYEGGTFQNVRITGGKAKVAALAGIYNNLTIDANGCTSGEMVNVTVTQQSQITISESVTGIDLKTQRKGAIDLHVNGGAGTYSFKWSNGATSEDIINLNDGTYTVTATDKYGCTQTKAITIPLPNLPPVAVADNYTTGCYVITGNLLANDYDPEGDFFQIDQIPVVNPLHGVLTLNIDGTFEYLANPGYTGEDLFRYAIYDQRHYLGDTAKVILHITSDTDCDGVADDIDADADGDGILNVNEGYPGRDTDGDEIPDYLDIDSDGDGIVDNIEAQGTAGYIAPLFMDTDGDGVDDAYDPDQKGKTIIPVDTDGDGIADFIDSDSDNDFVPDYIEGHDINADGKADQFAIGKDSDADGLDDAYDTVNRFTTSGNMVGSNAPMQDFDGDGLRDWRDDNDDDDLYLTKYEDLNADGDFSNDDTDFDGHPEYLDYGRDCDLFIPDIFTPNNDNIHDFFQVYCINHYPNAKMYVFDQLGNKIFERDHYGNLDFWGTRDRAWWNGKSENGKGKASNVRVSVGTYFYVLDLGNGEVKKSFVFVSY